MTPEEVEESGIQDDWETDSGPCFQGVLILRFLETMGSPKIIFADRIAKDKELKFTYARGAMLSYIVNQGRNRFPPKGWPLCPDEFYYTQL
jgi:hypothetical protein